MEETTRPEDEPRPEAPEAPPEPIFRDRAPGPDDEPDVVPPTAWSLRGDLADLPRLIGTRAVRIPALLVVISSVAYLLAVRVDDVTVATIALLLSILFLEVPPIGGIVLAAILADRSSYLAGAIAGFLGPLGLTVVIVGSWPLDQLPSIGLVVVVLLESTLLGLLIGGVVSLARTGWRRLTKG